MVVVVVAVVAVVVVVVVVVVAPYIVLVRPFKSHSCERGVFFIVFVCFYVVGCMLYMILFSFVLYAGMFIFNVKTHLKNIRFRLVSTL